MLEQFVNIFPDVVWSAILASLLTLGGVVLTNRDNNKRLMAELLHDKEQRDREREMSIRREVYFDAAQSVSKALNSVAKVSNINIEDNELGVEISECTAAFSRMALPAS